MRKIWRWIKHLLEAGEHVEFIHGASEWIEHAFGLRAAVLSIMRTAAASVWASVKGLDPLLAFIVGLLVLALTLFTVNQTIRYRTNQQGQKPPLPSSAILEQSEHRLRKYYAVADA